MRAVAGVVLAVLLGASGPAAATEPLPPADRPAPAAPVPAGVFRRVAVVVEVGSVPLAAYQVEITPQCAAAAVVGVEGGEPAAFRSPPHYDPAALRGGRIVLAAFSTAADLPRGAVRVAVLHLHDGREAACSFGARVMAATDAGGRDVATQVRLIALEENAR